MSQFAPSYINALRPLVENKKDFLNECFNIWETYTPIEEVGDEIEAIASQCGVSYKYANTQHRVNGILITAREKFLKELDRVDGRKELEEVANKHFNFFNAFK